MKPQILALLGSPLPEGNTAKLLKQAISGAEKAGCEVTLIDVPSLEFSSCREMYYCKEQSSCILEDDMGPIYPLLKNMDSLILATPVMTMGIPGHLKSFMDRCQVFYCAKYERKVPLIPKEKKKIRKTLLISISGMNLPNNFDGVKISTLAFCDILDCRLADELLVRDMDTKEDLDRYPDILQEAYQKGFALGAALTHVS
ncbi:MAG TPA: flavodoxin family protein [Methanospirillum sp.]|uniref:flavodoxin family protein n=1 Tax=Methanospirillum sp. TaxID=45200 RepID=UPI002BF35E10|nr:flavodoxin family protein [Methanospirillum sp.]HOJ95348.1 flavodoxin family protein [Methanospirillum sp.]HOL41498.1 flavodoxin family protein [Methanospirillum sp.]HPP76742.1 flavodoxin family protein [Methanospirillum sp.]